jgi:hypothetical protein
MFRKLTVLVNLGLVLALMLAVLPLNGAMAATKPGEGFKLVYPNTGEACAKFAKFNLLGKGEGVMVEYIFYTWASGKPEVIGAVWSPKGEQVRYEYPGGIGNGRYSVVATAYDAEGSRVFKKGAKWTITCEKQPRDK